MHVSWPDVTILCLAAAHAILAFACLDYVYSADNNQQHLTRATPFTDWQTLLNVYRYTVNYTDSNVIKAQALNAAWCNYTLPAATVLPPFCQCVAAQHAIYTNQTYAVRRAIPPDLANTLAKNVLNCLSVRSTWRVFPFWSVQTATPVYYVMMISVCFLVTAIRTIDLIWLGIVTTWTVAVLTVVVLCVKDVAVNGLWSLAFFSAALVIHLILTPGLRRPPFQAYAYESCFWFAEFFIAPVFFMFVPIYNGSRDAVFVLMMATMGGLLGSLGLRSFWYSIAFRNKPLLLPLLRWCAWIAILALSIAFALVTAAYYQPSTVTTLAGGSVALQSVTCLVALMQVPGVPSSISFPMQMALCMVRNIAFASLVLYDLNH